MTEQAVELSIFARPIRRLPPAEKGTKKTGPSARSGMPFSPRMKRAASCPRRCVCCFQAGLLTPGSSSHYVFPLVPINLANSDFCNVRPRLQWRARPGFAPGSHFQPVRAGGNGPPETLGRHHDLLIPPIPVFLQAVKKGQAWNREMQLRCRPEKQKYLDSPVFRPCEPGAARTAALAVHHPLTKCFLIASICCTHSMVPMNRPFRSRTAM